MERVNGLCGEEEGEYYTLVANVKCLRRNVRLVIWYPKGLAGVREKGGGYKLFFSTYTGMDAEKCVMVYKSRFQLDFAFNASLSAISTAKAAIMEMGEDLSVGEYTALMHRTLIYQRVICVSGINLDSAINRRVMNELVMLAKNAA